jgi:hypothetical protein
MIPFEDAERWRGAKAPHLHQRVFSKNYFSRDVSPKLGVN